jgi:hypothetical protein
MTADSGGIVPSAALLARIKARRGSTFVPLADAFEPDVSPLWAILEDLTRLLVRHTEEIKFELAPPRPTPTSSLPWVTIQRRPSG